MGYPAWMNIEDRLWHGWAFGSSLLVLFALVLIVAPKHLVAGPMAAAGIMGLTKAVRSRKETPRSDA